jgi:CHAD domain-containing protein
LTRGNASILAVTEANTIRLALKNVRRKLRKKSRFNVDFKVLLKGIVRSYRKGRRSLIVLETAPTLEGLHDLRRRVKDQVYQLRLFTDLSPSILGPETDEFELLAEQLGEHRDLASLKSALESSLGTPGVVPDRREVTDWTEKRLFELEEAAMRLARRLYSEPPKSKERQLLTFLDSLIRAP